MCGTLDKIMSELMTLSTKERWGWPIQHGIFQFIPLRRKESISDWKIILLTGVYVWERVAVSSLNTRAAERRGATIILSICIMLSSV